METLVSEAEYKSDLYHIIQEHGPIWTLLNQMLHIIVLFYTIFGIIRFKVIYSRMVVLVRWISVLVVTFNWYITIKFVALAALLYLFSMELESRKVTLLQFNCSLDQYGHFMAQQLSGTQASNTIRRSATGWPVVLANLLHLVGGPYRLLAIRAALLYGFFSLSIFIMLALFPLEHYYFDIGFNYIHFVLNDDNCLFNCYGRKRRHLERLKNWSRNMNSSLITLSMKRAINQRELRSFYVHDQLLGFTSPTNQRSTPGEMSARAGTGKGLRDSLSEPNDEGTAIQLVQADPLAASLDQLKPEAAQLYTGRLALGGKHAAMSQRSLDQLIRTPVKSLRHTLATNHSNEPSYCVKVANENLKRFKPYVRSESWFKISMVVYPIFILYYFISLTFVVGAVTVFFTGTFQSVIDICLSRLREKGFHAEASSRLDEFINWSRWDYLTFIEGKYSVFALSFASSFYCSYYFGTILELLIWIEEISQQMNLCRVITEFLGVQSSLISLASCSRDTSLPASCGQRAGQLWPPTGVLAATKPKIGTKTNPFIDAIVHTHHSVKDPHLIGNNINQFGGLNCIWAHCKFRLAPQSQRLRKFELMAIRLASKRQTVLRATYINLNMFFDELKDTRFMTTIILRRTTQMVFGFALMVSITRSQFEKDIIYMSMMLFSCLAILNLYLICAALINSSINKLLPQIHALISVSIKAGTDHDLLEFWLRHIQAYGLDKDAMSYKIYGYKVTWSTILNVSFTIAISLLVAMRCDN